MNIYLFIISLYFFISYNIFLKYCFFYYSYLNNYLKIKIKQFLFFQNIIYDFNLNSIIKKYLSNL